MRIFFVITVQKKKVVRPVDVSMLCVVFLLHKQTHIAVLSKNDPEVSGSGRGASPTYSGPNLIHFEQTHKKLPKQYLL